MTPADRFTHLPALLSADPDLRRRGHGLTVECRVDIGPEPFHLLLSGGSLATLDRGPRLMRSSTFAVRGTDEAWTRHWDAMPAPGWHDVFALTKRGVASIDGDRFCRTCSTSRTSSRY